MTKYQIFKILPQISHFHKYRNFFKYIRNFLDQLLHPYKFYVRDMSGILFFIFASCEPLNIEYLAIWHACLAFKHVLIQSTKWWQERFLNCWTHFLQCKSGQWFQPGGGYSVQKTLRGCATNMGSKISLLVYEWPLIKCQILYMNGSIFQHFPKFEPKFK